MIFPEETMVTCDPCGGTGHRLGSATPIEFWKCCVCGGEGTLHQYMGFQPSGPMNPVVTMQSIAKSVMARTSKAREYLRGLGD